MYLKSPDGSIEISVSVFSNKFIFGFPTGELRKKKIKTNTKKNKSEQLEKVKQKKKDPEDNLGNVITTIDTGRIERGVDYISVENAIQSLLTKHKLTIKELFGNIDLVSSLCESFEYTLKDLISLLVEHNPDVFNLSFLRTVIRPLIVKIKEEKQNYEEENEHNNGYRFVFDVL